MPNRLANSASPYLRQHANNPVDWYPWGDEALERAKREDKPIFLSVGYSSCHWCHVMEHESFEDEAVAAFLNENFISIKVDREERPDLDEVYMTAVQLQAGRGGWPMSVFLTPDKQPFLAGTYFPKEDRGQMPGFRNLIGHVYVLWSQRRAEVDEVAKHFANQLEEALSREAPKSFNGISFELVEQTLNELAANFDGEHGGFGSAPKFPPHTALEFLLAASQCAALDQTARDRALQMVTHTLEAMALGGIHDQFGGGFHRYSTDAIWRLPHFEKMLYDNALILGNFARAASAIESAQPFRAEQFRKVEKGIIDWLKREMSAPNGLYYSALDADTEGHEGKTYVWTMKEVLKAVPDEGESVAWVYQFEPQGNFRDEATQELTQENVPHRRSFTESVSQDALDKLMEVRNQRVQPGLDDKCLIGWNGLLVAALADAGETELAQLAFDAIERSSPDWRSLPRYLAGESALGEAYLEDVAAVGWAAWRLFQATGNERFLNSAKTILSVMHTEFGDELNGGFFATSRRHEKLFGRLKPVFDQPIPSANSLAIRLQIALGEYEGAAKALQANMGWMERAPQATEGLHLAGLEWLLAQSECAEGQVRPEVRPVAVEVLFTPSELLAQEDGWAEGAVTILLPDGYHINGQTPPAAWLVPTTVGVEGLESVVEFPEADEFGYESDVRIGVRVRMSGKRSAEECEVRVTYQPCSATECLQPETKRFAVLVRAPYTRI